MVRSVRRTGWLLMLLSTACGSGSQPARSDAAVDAATDPDGHTDIDAPHGTLTPDPPDPVAAPCTGRLLYPGVPLVGIPGATSVATGRFNADNHVDVIATKDNGVYIVYGVGNGAFGVPVHVVAATTTNARRPVVADVDGGGTADVLFKHDGGLTVVMNSGSGTFTTQTLNVQSTSHALADLDGDGDTELLTVSGSQFFVFENQGASFASPVAYASSTSQPSYDLVVVDFSGDGKPDVAAVSSDNTVSLAINDGTGAFASPVSYATGDAHQAIATGDFNGDGKADIATTGPGPTPGETLSILLNQGTGSFAPRVDYVLPHVAYSMAVGDLDTDGKLDIALPRGESNGLTIARGVGDGTFTIADYGAPAVRARVSLGDFDGNGKLDVATVAGDVVVYLNEGGTKPFPSRDRYDFNGSRFVHADQDGNLDLLGVGHDLAASKSFLETRAGDGTGTFGTASRYPLGVFSNILATTDLDNDGRADAITGLYAAGQAFLRDAGGGFTARTPFVVPEEWIQSIAAGDVNGDGWRDLLLAVDHSGQTGSVQLLRGRGDGTFHAATLVTTPERPLGAALADVDSDGHLDAIVTYSSTLQNDAGLVIARGTGAGTFLAPAVYSSTPTVLFRPYVRDLDKDGLADVVASSGYGGIEVRLGTGSGGLGMPAQYPHTGSSQEVAFGDLNGDGNLDAVTASTVQQAVLISLGIGDGTFMMPLAFDAGSGVRGLALADVNADGRIDIVVENSYTSTSSVLLGRCVP